MTIIKSLKSSSLVNILIKCYRLLLDGEYFINFVSNWHLLKMPNRLPKMSRYYFFQIKLKKK